MYLSWYLEGTFHKLFVHFNQLSLPSVCCLLQLQSEAKAFSLFHSKGLKHTDPISLVNPHFVIFPDVVQFLEGLTLLLGSAELDTLTLDLK